MNHCQQIEKRSEKGNLNYPKFIDTTTWAVQNSHFVSVIETADMVTMTTQSRLNQVQVYPDYFINIKNIFDIIIIELISQPETGQFFLE